MYPIRARTRAFGFRLAASGASCTWITRPRLHFRQRIVEADAPHHLRERRGSIWTDREWMVGKQEVETPAPSTGGFRHIEKRLQRLGVSHAACWRRSLRVFLAYSNF